MRERRPRRARRRSTARRRCRPRWRAPARAWWRRRSRSPPPGTTPATRARARGACGRAPARTRASRSTVSMRSSVSMFPARSPQAASRVPSGGASPRVYLPVSTPLASGKYGMSVIPSRSIAGSASLLDAAVEEAVVVLHVHERPQARWQRPRRPPRRASRAEKFEHPISRTLPASTSSFERGERLGDGRRRRRGRAGDRGRRSRCPAAPGCRRSTRRTFSALPGAMPSGEPRMPPNLVVITASPRRAPSAVPRNSSDCPLP